MNRLDFWDYKKLLKILPFYNILIDSTEKPKIKRLSNVELLNVLPFYNSLYIKDYQKHLKDMQKVFLLK